MHQTQAEAQPHSQEYVLRNLRAIMGFDGRIALKLNNFKPVTRIVPVGDDDYDIEFSGKRLYGEGAGKHLEQMRAVDFKGLTILLNPPSSGDLCEDANTAVVRMLERATDEGIAFQTAPTLDSNMTVVVLGLGLGLHVLPLVERTRCRNLIIVEPNLDFIYHSLSAMDWQELIERFRQDNRFLAIFPFAEPNLLASELRHIVRCSGPAFLDGLRFVQAYENSQIREAMDRMRSDAQLLSIGLGFLADEFDMLRNSHGNLRHGATRLFAQRDGKKLPLPAFVMGSGPSIDRDLETIRANQDRALVITCGTALRIALTNGIVPDFHVELENVPEVYDVVLERLAQKFDLSPVTLVASSTVDPRISRLFGRTAFYFRAGLSSFEQFCPDPRHNLRFPMPTVSNSGVSLACELGAHDVYLFGIDLGARDPKNHHAKDSPYMAGEAEFKNTEIDMPVAANFGGICYTERVYIWSRSILEESFQFWRRGRNFFNCSDGVRIKGTLPKSSRALTLPSVPDKAELVRSLYDEFPAYTQADFERAWQTPEMHRRIDAFLDRVLATWGDRETVTGGPMDDPAVTQSIVDLSRVLVPLDNKVSPELLEIRGTTIYALLCIHFYMARVGDERRRRFIEICDEEFRALVEHLRGRIHRFYDFVDSWDGETPSQEFGPFKNV